MPPKVHSPATKSVPVAKPTVLQPPHRRPGEWPQDCLPAQTESRCASVDSCIHNEEIGPRADLFPRLTNKFDHYKPPTPGALTLSALWLTFGLLRTQLGRRIGFGTENSNE